MIKTGMRFARWLVIADPVVRDRRSYVDVKCDCGTIRSIELQSLKRHQSKSCGCLKKEATSARKTTHGACKKGRSTSEFTTWQGIRRRCTDPGDAAYHDYGGRGITVCDRWLESFANFLADMGERPPGLTLDRKDNNGNYDPNNCRWASRVTQGRNKRNNRIVILDGISMPLSAAAEKRGLRYRTVHQRISQYNWSVERALETPIHTRTDHHG